VTPEGNGKQKRADRQKTRKSNAERALANLRAAKRAQREISEPAERAWILLAEANVLALLDVADALGALSAATGGLQDDRPAGGG
jgi:hypothetical protein